MIALKLYILYLRATTGVFLRVEDPTHNGHCIVMGMHNIQLFTLKIQMTPFPSVFSLRVLRRLTYMIRREEGLWPLT